MLTTRQLAIVAWLANFVVWAFTRRDVRSSIWSLLRTLFSLKLLVLFTTIIGYNVVAVWCLWRAGYWDPSMLYDTVLIVAVAGIGSVSRAASQGVTYNGRFFLRTILVNFEVMVVLVFLSDFFPFNFWIEFLLVVPLFTVLAMLVVVSGYQKGAEQVHRFLGGVQASIGLLLIPFVLWQAIRNYRHLMQLPVLFSLGLPFVMSLLFVPALFLACAVFAYEDAFLLVSFRGRDDERLAHWKMRALLLRFGLNLRALQLFRRSAAIHEFGWAKDKKEAVGSTGRCNTDYGLVSIGRWRDGADGPAGFDGRTEAGAVVAMACW